jgi:hypothetical protein
MPNRRAPIPSRHIAAVVVGKLQFYDFLTYAFFAVYIGRAFLPSDNASSSLLASLAAFGASFRDGSFLLAYEPGDCRFLR